MNLSVFTDVLGVPFEQALDLLADIGLSFVDLRSKIGPNSVDTLGGARIGEVVRAIAARKLRVACIASWGVNPMDGQYDPADHAYRQAMRERTKRLADLAAELGATSVRVYSFKRSAGKAREQDRADNAAFLSELACICGERGRILLVENEPPTLTATCDELGDLMRRAVSGSLKINWDIVNGWRADEVPWAPGVFEHIATHVAHVHLKGARANADGSFASMALPGNDDVPHEEILRKLVQSGFDGTITIDPHYGQFAEADRLPGEASEIDVVRRSVEYLRPMLPRLIAERGPRVAPMRIGEAPREKYPHGDLHWLASAAANGARELTFGYTTIAPGGRNPLHRHPNCEEVLYVIAGEIEHVVDGTPNAKLVRGEAILIPRNARHQAINIGSAMAELIVAFSSAHRETVLET